MLKNNIIIIKIIILLTIKKQIANFIVYKTKTFAKNMQ